MMEVEGEHCRAECHVVTCFHFPIDITVAAQHMTLQNIQIFACNIFAETGNVNMYLPGFERCPRPQAIGCGKDIISLQHSIDQLKVFLLEYLGKNDSN